MAGFLAIPIGAQQMGYAMPQKLALAFILIGLIGGVVTGVAAKGQDEHSTESQVENATVQKPKEEAQAVVDAKVAAVEAPIVASKAAEVPKP